MADGTQYTIDIAADMSGGDETISRLMELSDQLTGGGAAAKLFDAAIGRTKAALAASGEAAASASAELAEGEQKYRQMERAAINAAKALERAGQKSSGAVPADLKAKADAAAAALTGEAKALDALRAKSAAATAEQKRLGNALKNLDAASKQAKRLDELSQAAAQGTGEFGPMSSALGQLGGPLGAVGSKVTGALDAFKSLGATLGTGPGAIVAVAVAAAAAVVTLTVAIGAAIVKTAQWAVGLADAKAKAALTVEALEQTSASLAGLGSILPGIARATNLTGDELGNLAKGLADAKVSAADMPPALRAAALAEKALAGEGAKLIAQMKAGKKSIGELADEAERKFGGIVSRKLLTLDEQAATLKRSLGETFGGLKIGALQKEMQRLISLFDASTASGQTMKFLFEKLFQPLIDAAVASGPFIERVFLGMQIGLLKLYIATQPAIKAVKKLLGIADTDTIDTLKIAHGIGLATAAGIATAAAVVGGLVAVLAAMAAPIILIQLYSKQAFDGLYNAAASALGFLQSVSLVAIGTAIIQGLANGIKAGASLVVDAITGTVKSAISAAEKLLDMGSPSRLFKQMGVFTAQGFAQGVEGETPTAKSALESLVEPPAPKAGAGSVGVEGKSGGHTFNITITAADGDAKSIADEVRQVLIEITEGDLAQVRGLEPAP